MSFAIQALDKFQLFLLPKLQKISHLAEAMVDNTKAADNSPGTDGREGNRRSIPRRPIAVFKDLHILPVIRFLCHLYIILVINEDTHLWECRRHILPRQWFEVYPQASQQARSQGTSWE